MSPYNTFTHTEPELLPVLEVLQRREPIFHTSEFAASEAEFENATAPDFWEVGASGRRYSRDFILKEIYRASPPSAHELGWSSRDYALRRLGEKTYLLTYTLQQGERLTRRSTVWEQRETGWRVLFHQGTVVTSENDDVAPIG